MDSTFGQLGKTSASLCESVMIKHLHFKQTNKQTKNVVMSDILENHNSNPLKYLLVTLQ